jgi:hypothetical protein
MPCCNRADISSQQTSSARSAACGDGDTWHIMAHAAAAHTQHRLEIAVVAAYSNLKIDKNSMLVFPRLPLNRVFGCFSAMGDGSNPQKKHFENYKLQIAIAFNYKIIVSNSSYKKIGQKSKPEPDFF